MRISVASVAVISRFESGQLQYLARWNERWNGFSLPGGHKRAGETHRACLVRELAEPDELHLPPPKDDPDAAAVALVENLGAACVFVDAEPLGRMVYEAFSKSKNEQTHYEIELFGASLSAEAHAVVAGESNLRWLSEQEIESGCTADGRPVSATLRHHLAGLSRQTPVNWELAELAKRRTDG